jgi:hypothetical protein
MLVNGVQPRLTLLLVNGVQPRLTPLPHIPYLYFTPVLFLLSIYFRTPPSITATLLSLLHLPLHFPPCSINSFHVSSFPLPTPQYHYDTYPISYLLFHTLLYFLLYYMMAASYSTIFPLSFPYSTISLYD